MAKLWNRRDVDFLLFEVLKVQELNRFDRYKDYDEDTYRMILDAAEQLAHEEYFPTNHEGDVHGTKYENGEVRVPESFRKLKQLFVEGGWMTLMDDYDLGGQQVPHTIGMITGCVFGAGNHSFTMFPGLAHGTADLIRTFGTDRQKELYMKPILDLTYGGTMCLTEPNAGSDVGNLTTTAKRNEDGTYSIKGQKIFISWGDHNLADNIVHAVLARIEGDPPGTKGISIFIVPKYRVNEDGSIGEFNNVVCTGVEHKMGIHASPTCALSFGDDGECIGELLGEERQGMRIMFQMMNGARLEVGMQGLSCSEPAYLYALEYAQERRQGTSITEFKNPEAPRAAIIEHPNVRRMLMNMKAKTEAMRAMLGFTALNLDTAHVATDEAEKDRANGIVELLIPIVKSWCTDEGFRVTEEAMQTLGGHGYLADHPIEQYMRDVKIGSLYEGTNGIQAMDLVGRKLVMKGGQYAMALLQRVAEDAARLKGNDDPMLKEIGEDLDRLRDHVGKTAMSIGQQFMARNLALPLLNAKPFLDAMGEVIATWLLSWEAEVAQQKLASMLADAGVTDEDSRKAFLASSSDAAFYDSKIRTAYYAAKRFLPMAEARLQGCDSGERAALDVVRFAEEEPTIVPA
ncbi:MAG: acyl-CoA dehydrogenase [Candidatus Dadabacteria bacterium]|nr:MAG: acyl-CoA dehydrogenase [Candidatus Dadabacteria bacterium]